MIREIKYKSLETKRAHKEKVSIYELIMDFGQTYVFNKQRARKMAKVYFRIAAEELLKGGSVTMPSIGTLFIGKKDSRSKKYRNPSRIGFSYKLYKESGDEFKYTLNNKFKSALDKILRTTNKDYRYVDSKIS